MTDRSDPERNLRDGVEVDFLRLHTGDGCGGIGLKMQDHPDVGPVAHDAGMKVDFHCWPGPFQTGAVRDPAKGNLLGGELTQSASRGRGDEAVSIQPQRQVAAAATQQLLGGGLVAGLDKRIGHLLWDINHDAYSLDVPVSAQLATFSPLTLLNSLTLFVTKVTPSERACAAIMRSIAPIGCPACSSSQRISP